MTLTKKKKRVAKNASKSQPKQQISPEAAKDEEELSTEEQLLKTKLEAQNTLRSMIREAEAIHKGKRKINDWQYTQSTVTVEPISADVTNASSQQCVRDLSVEFAKGNPSIKILHKYLDDYFLRSSNEEVERAAKMDAPNSGSSTDQKSIISFTALGQPSHDSKTLHKSADDIVLKKLQNIGSKKLSGVKRSAFSELIPKATRSDQENIEGRLKRSLISSSVQPSRREVDENIEEEGGDHLNEEEDEEEEEENDEDSDDSDDADEDDDEDEDEPYTKEAKRKKSATCIKRKIKKKPKKDKKSELAKAALMCKKRAEFAKKLSRLECEVSRIDSVGSSYSIRNKLFHEISNKLIPNKSQLLKPKTGVSGAKSEGVTSLGKKPVDEIQKHNDRVVLRAQEMFSNAQMKTGKGKKKSLVSFGLKGKKISGSFDSVTRLKDKSARGAKGETNLFRKENATPKSVSEKKRKDVPRSRAGGTSSEQWQDEGRRPITEGDPDVEIEGTSMRDEEKDEKEYKKNELGLESYKELKRLVNEEVRRIRVSLAKRGERVDGKKEPEKPGRKIVKPPMRPVGSKRTEKDNDGDDKKGERPSSRKKATTDTTPYVPIPNETREQVMESINLAQSKKMDRKEEKEKGAGERSQPGTPIGDKGKATSKKPKSADTVRQALTRNENKEKVSKERAKTANEHKPINKLTKPVTEWSVFKRLEIAMKSLGTFPTESEESDVKLDPTPIQSRLRNLLLHPPKIPTQRVRRMKLPDSRNDAQGRIKTPKPRPRSPEKKVLKDELRYGKDMKETKLKTEVLPARKNKMFPLERKSTTDPNKMVFKLFEKPSTGSLQKRMSMTDISTESLDKKKGRPLSKQKRPSISSRSTPERQEVEKINEHEDEILENQENEGVAEIVAEGPEVAENETKVSNELNEGSEEKESKDNPFVFSYLRDTDLKKGNVAQSIIERMQSHKKTIERDISRIEKRLAQTFGISNFRFNDKNLKTKKQDLQFIGEKLDEAIDYVKKFQDAWTEMSMQRLAVTPSKMSMDRCDPELLEYLEKAFPSQRTTTDDQQKDSGQTLYSSLDSLTPEEDTAIIKDKKETSTETIERIKLFLKMKSEHEVVLSREDYFSLDGSLTSRMLENANDYKQENERVSGVVESSVPAGEVHDETNISNENSDSRIRTEAKRRSKSKSKSKSRSKSRPKTIEKSIQMTIPSRNNTMLLENQGIEPKRCTRERESPEKPLWSCPPEIVPERSITDPRPVHHFVIRPSSENKENILQDLERGEFPGFFNAREQKTDVQPPSPQADSRLFYLEHERPRSRKSDKRSQQISSPKKSNDNEFKNQKFRCVPSKEDAASPYYRNQTHSIRRRMRSRYGPGRMLTSSGQSDYDTTDASVVNAAPYRRKSKIKRVSNGAEEYEKKARQRVQQESSLPSDYVTNEMEASEFLDLNNIGSNKRKYTTDKRSSRNINEEYTKSRSKPIKKNKDPQMDIMEYRKRIIMEYRLNPMVDYKSKILEERDRMKAGQQEMNVKESDNEQRGEKFNFRERKSPLRTTGSSHKNKFSAKNAFLQNVEMEKVSPHESEEDIRAYYPKIKELLDKALTSDDMFIADRDMELPLETIKHRAMFLKNQSEGSEELEEFTAVDQYELDVLSLNRKLDSGTSLYSRRISTSRKDWSPSWSKFPAEPHFPASESDSSTKNDTGRRSPRGMRHSREEALNVRPPPELVEYKRAPSGNIYRPLSPTDSYRPSTPSSSFKNMTNKVIRPSSQGSSRSTSGPTTPVSLYRPTSPGSTSRPTSPVSSSRPPIVVGPSRPTSPILNYRPQSPVNNYRTTSPVNSPRPRASANNSVTSPTNSYRAKSPASSPRAKTPIKTIRPSSPVNAVASNSYRATSPSQYRATSPNQYRATSPSQYRTTPPINLARQRSPLSSSRPTSSNSGYRPTSPVSSYRATSPASVYRTTSPSPSSTYRPPSPKNAYRPKSPNTIQTPEYVKDRYGSPESVPQTPPQKEKESIDSLANRRINAHVDDYFAYSNNHNDSEFSKKKREMENILRLNELNLKYILSLEASNPLFDFPTQNTFPKTSRSHLEEL